MSTEDRFERTIEDWLSLQAPTSAPPGVHDGVIDRARTARQRPAWLVTLRGGTLRAPERVGLGLPRTAYLLAVLALVVAGVLVVLAIGAYRSPSPLGRNGSIVFSWQGNNHSGGGTAMIDANTTGRREIIAGSCPTFSRDGTVLYYPGSGDATELVLEPVDGSPLTRLPIPLVFPWIAFRSYDLSPDGTRVAWLKPGRGVEATPAPDGSTSGIETKNELWVSGVSGGPGTMVVPAPEAPYVTFGQPAWAPDGSSIAFVEWEYDLVGTDFINRRSSIVVAQADGSGFRRLSTRQVMSDVPAWSPDGRFLALIGRPDDETGDQPRGLFVIRTDGTDARNLTRSPTHERDPAWSPRGDAIAFITEGDVLAHLTVIPLDEGAKARPAVQGPVTSTFVWAPDGTSLLFVESTSTPPAWDGAGATSKGTFRTVDRWFQQPPSAPLAEIEGTVICPLSWQRLAP